MQGKIKRKRVILICSSVNIQVVSAQHKLTTVLYGAWCGVLFRSSEAGSLFGDCVATCCLGFTWVFVSFGIVWGQKVPLLESINLLNMGSSYS